MLIMKVIFYFDIMVKKVNDVCNISEFPKYRRLLKSRKRRVSLLNYPRTIL